jgi:3-methyl-2-oxobutanoate hydroxymethyltransferase
MSKLQKAQGKVTLSTLFDRYQKGQKISMVTCYDYSFARLIDQTEVELVLVGDSLGNVILGLPDTIQVTVDDVAFCVRGVSAGLKRSFLIADMPFMSFYDETTAMRNVETLLRAGAQGVKIEGGLAIAPLVEKIVTMGIPVMGHVGFTPQSIHMLSGYRVQGRDANDAEVILNAAKSLQDAGAFAIVLELVTAPLAKTITDTLKIPTIGIGAGPDCSGQVLVLHDLLGFESQAYKHVREFAKIGDTVTAALRQFTQEVRAKEFPTAQHSF